jgi:hypothetical protein
MSCALVGIINWFICFSTIATFDIVVWFSEIIQSIYQMYQYFLTRSCSFCPSSVISKSAFCHFLLRYQKFITFYCAVFKLNGVALVILTYLIQFGIRVRWQWRAPVHLYSRRQSNTGWSKSLCALITIQKITSNVQIFPSQSPDIYWHAEMCSWRPCSV